MPGPARPFAPGVSGNPAGRPAKTPEMREAEALARQFCPEAIRALKRTMDETDDDKARIIAANSILDRALGKPVQAITGADGEPLLQLDFSRLSDGDLSTLVRVSQLVTVGPGEDGGDPQGGGSGAGAPGG